MTTYVYETIPRKKGERSTRFEIRQSMKEAALTRHPETGVPIRRVPMGGYGLMGVKSDSSPASPPSPGTSCARGGCGCHP